MTTDALSNAHVSPGGPAVTHPLGGASLRKFSVGDMDNNVYVLTAASGERLLVDAAADPERILEELVHCGEGELVGLVTTHRHHDHVGALEQVQRATGVTTLAGRHDADALPVPTDRALAHGDTISVGELEVSVIELRGHTPGSVALAITEPQEGQHPGRAHLLTGDSLFPGGPGKTWSEEDFASLMDDLQERVFDVYGDDTRVYPGHGDDTLLGTERPQLSEWRERGW